MPWLSVTPNNCGLNCFKTRAVAGFSPEELSVRVEDQQLVIRGKQVDDKERLFLHRGIAARQFQRNFVLAEGIAMGTRFLLSADSKVPQHVKDAYLGTNLMGTVVTTAIDGAPQAIERFTSEQRPLRVAIVIDTSPTSVISGMVVSTTFTVLVSCGAALPDESETL